MRLSRLALPLLLCACKQPDPPPIGDSWADSFDRASIGSDYVATADVYRINDGALNVSNGYNHPLWLRKKLPRDAEIEFDVTSRSDAGDTKIELWGDGESFARDKGAYTATGYVFIMGGWHNSKSEIAKGDEHAPTLPSRTTPKVEIGKTYHWKIVRKGTHIDWFVDDMTKPFLQMDDPQPWEGSGHEYLGFNDWEADLTFDNLKIRKIP